MIGDHSSYHEALTGRQAKRRLQLFCDYKRDCSRCYLTRFSSENNAYALSVYRREKDGEIMVHFEIVIDRHGDYSIKGKIKKFKSIDELLVWYQENQLDARMTTIGHSCSKQDYNSAVEAEETKKHEEKLRRQQEDFRRQQEELRRRQEEEMRRLEDQRRKQNKAVDTDDSEADDAEGTDDSEDNSEDDNYEGQQHNGAEHEEERDERAGDHGGADQNGVELHQQHRMLHQRQFWRCTIS